MQMRIHELQKLTVKDLHPIDTENVFNMNIK